MGHYENRYFSKCIFCLRDSKEVGKLTKEHYFGKAIAKKIPTKGNYTAVSKKGNSPIVSKKGSSPISNITLKALCNTCNNDVLGRKLMDPVSKIIIDLFSGNTTIIPKSKILLVKNYFSRLGMLVDIASSNYNIESDAIDKLLNNTNSELSKFDPVISDIERRKFIEKFEAPRLSVQVAHYTDNNAQEGPATIRSIAQLDRKQLKAIPTEKEFVMIYHKLAFVVRIGEQKSWGAYPGFKLLPSFYYKNQFKLPSINYLQAKNIFVSGPLSGPQRPLAPKVADL